VFQKGDQIGTYTLIEKLGKGSFGEVWLAEEKTVISSHRAALKLPNEEDVDLDGIRQEAHVWESVKGHPNILPIIKADIYEGQIYIASEYAPDGSLSEWLKKHGGKAPLTEIAVQMTLGILAGLEHLHSKGVIHRDLKPANILLQAETPRIADFGIARLTQATNAGSTLSAGTPSYMAPECFYGIRSEQTDIWSVGIIFHKLLSGKLPFAQPDQVSLMNSILNGEPEIDSEISAPLRKIIRKALQKDPAERYQKASQIREDLSNYNFEVLGNEDEDTVVQTAAPIEPVFEKEEVTIVRPKTPEVIFETVEDTSSNPNKTWAIALASFLVLAAVTVWAAFQFSVDSSETNSQFSDSLNESNGNFNSANTVNKVPSTDFNTSGDRTNLPTMPMNSGASDSNSVNVETSESSNKTDGAATPLPIQPTEDPVIVNRQQPAKSASPEENASPSPTPAKKPAPTPIEIAPEPPVRPPARTTKPAPKTTEKPNETPPPLKNEATDGK
jgi:serine/threonine protein kinase